MAQPKSTIMHNPLAGLSVPGSPAPTGDEQMPPAEAAAPAGEQPAADPAPGPAEMAPQPETHHAEPHPEEIPLAETLHEATSPEATAAAPPAHDQAHEAAHEADVPLAAEAVAAEPEPPVFASTPDAEPGPERRRAAGRIMRRHMAFSGVAGLVPLPAVDVATVAGVQVKMLHAMTRLYGIPFNARLARQWVLALIAGGGSVMLAVPAASATKALPVVGTAASFLLSPAFSTLSCYATGRVFIRHFEAGGRLETFDPAKAQAETAAA